VTPRSLIEPARLAGASLLRTQTDARLIDLTRAGHERAFEAIVERYRRPLLRHCQRMLPGERAEDAVQQAFVSAYHALVADDRSIDLKPWLYRIAHNACLSALRQNGWNHEELGEGHDGVEAPDQVFERRERLGAAVASVKGLPDRQREAVVLRELEGRSYDEIAIELGVSGGAVRQLLSRARVQLRTAATAVVPIGLFFRGPGEAQAAQAAQPTTARIAELSVGGAGVGATIAKVSATVLATGALVGGAAQTPLLPGGDDSNRAVAAATDRPSGEGTGKDDARRAAASGAADDDLVPDRRAEGPTGATNEPRGEHRDRAERDDGDTDGDGRRGEEDRSEDEDHDGSGGDSGEAAGDEERDDGDSDDHSGEGGDITSASEEGSGSGSDASSGSGSDATSGSGSDATSDSGSGSDATSGSFSGSGSDATSGSGTETRDEDG